MKRSEIVKTRIKNNLYLFNVTINEFIDCEDITLITFSCQTHIQNQFELRKQITQTLSYCYPRNKITINSIRDFSISNNGFVEKYKRINVIIK